MKKMLAFASVLAGLALVSCGDDSSSASNSACLIKDATGKNIACIEASSGDFGTASCDSLAFIGSTVAASGTASIDGSCSATGKITTCTGSGNGGSSTITVYDSSAAYLCSAQ